MPTKHKRSATVEQTEDLTKSHVTVDHDKIREWAEQRGGHPSTVTRTEKHGEPGILRIDFPGYSGEGTLEEIDWEPFFDKFEKEHLAFLFQEKTKGGQVSRFFKFIERPPELEK